MNDLLAIEEATALPQEELDDFDDVETCPGCGCRPGDGLTVDCDDPNGCGFWRAAGQADRGEAAPAFNSVDAHKNTCWH